MGYFLAAALAYALGSSNMAFYIARYKGVDLRGAGTGNLGASNATILLGWLSGVLVGIHDIGKAILAVWLAKTLFPELPAVGAVAGVACVLGHIFPFYLRFRGGKGFAPYLGMTIALSWKLAIFILILVVVVTLLTDYISLATLATVTVVPIGMGVSTGGILTPLILLVATAVIVFKHRENITRLRRGTEIGLRSAASGKHKIQ